ncbi:MAG: glycerol-3-phosphate dehydrogenase, partial [Christensenellales bacterium]
HAIARKVPERRLSISAIGGPCTSYELADHYPTYVAFCGEDFTLLEKFRNMLKTPYYHISLSTDIAGVECAVALKNAYAVAVSLSIGLAEKQDGEGCREHYNPQAALFGQSVREMMGLIKLMGGGEENIVYGAGDLYVTIFGGRSRRLGKLLGRGLTIAQALSELDGVTLESMAIATCVARALRKLEAAGRARTSDYPLLMHLDAILNKNAAVDIPWEAFAVDKK